MSTAGAVPMILAVTRDETRGVAVVTYATSDHGQAVVTLSLGMFDAGYATSVIQAAEQSRRDAVEALAAGAD